MIDKCTLYGSSYNFKALPYKRVFSLRSSLYKEISLVTHYYPRIEFIYQ